MIRSVRVYVSVRVRACEYDWKRLNNYYTPRSDVTFMVNGFAWISVVQLNFVAGHQKLKICSAGRSLN